MWPFRKKEELNDLWRERSKMSNDEEYDEYEEEYEREPYDMLYFLIHFMPHKVYVYVSEDDFYDDDGVVRIRNKEGCMNYFMGNLVWFEKKSFISRNGTIKEVLDMYDLKESENTPYKIIEIEPYQDEDDDDE
ncbi:TPA: hypothetical protein ACTZ3A_001513 [Bacillus cereus]